MSRASLAVRFPDGLILHGIYRGTTDIACCILYSTSKEAWDRCLSKSLDLDRICKHDESACEQVQVYTDYGGGFYWASCACRQCRFITGITMPFDDCLDEMVHGKPDWMN